MNLLDTASLVVTPNGYKASKLYSIIPTDGTGDMTFARTGDTATRVNSSGLIETVLANKPRLDYLGGTCPKLLLEPQRTNLVTYSDAFDNAAWSKANMTITANSIASLDGTTNAETFNESAHTASESSIYRSITTTTNVAYSFSIFLKKGTQRYVFINHYYGASQAYLTGIVDLEAGLITKTQTGTSITGGSNKLESYGNGWYRYSVTGTNSGTSYAPIIGISPTATATIDTTGSINSTGTGTQNFYLWGAQLEAGSYATSYIPTTTASVTRNADSCVKTTITSLLGQTEGTIFADINFNKASAAFIDIVSMYGTNVVEIQYNNSDGKIYFVYYQAGDLCRIPSTTTIVKGNRYKLAGAYKNNDFIFYINGVQQGTDTSGTITGSLSNFGINGWYSPSQSNNEIVELNSAAHWKTRLTNQELVTLTSL